MVARSHIVELLSEADAIKGTAFLDVSGGTPWITPSKVFFIEESANMTGVYGAFLRYLIKGRDKQAYEQALTNPVLSVSRMVSTGKLVIFINTGRMLIVVSESAKPKLNEYQVGWLESRFLVDGDSNLKITNNPGALDTAKNVPASYVVYKHGSKPDTVV